MRRLDDTSDWYHSLLATCARFDSRSSRTLSNKPRTSSTAKDRINPLNNSDNSLNGTLSSIADRAFSAGEKSYSGVTGLLEEKTGCEDRLRAFEELSDVVGKDPNVIEERAE